VGIGTASPSFKLEVQGDSRIVASETNTVTTGLSIIGEGDNNNPAQINFDKSKATTKGGFKASVGAAPDRGMFFWVDNVDRMNISKTGNVGIGTQTPTKGKLEVNGSTTGYSFANVTPPYPGFGIFYSHKDAFNQSASEGDTATNGKISIHASEAVVGTMFLAFSDVRIKNVAGRSDSASDLATLMKIEVTDYSFKDIVGKGGGMHKKVLAQQVESVFPQAVRRSKDAVPDIYRHATVTDGWLALSTDLEKGQRVRLINDGHDGVYEVVSAEPGRVLTTYKAASEGDKVFVFGREVDDFRSVDYEAIAMLNVSATQEVKREKDAEVKALREQNAALTAEVASLRSELAVFAAQEKTRDAKLASIEKLLQSSQTVMARPAKAATANGQE